MTRGFRALASSLVPVPRVRRSRLRLRSGSGSGSGSEDLHFGKVLCCVFSRHDSAELNAKLAGPAQHPGQEAWPCGSDHCHTRCCWHSSTSAMRRKPLLLFTLPRIRSLCQTLHRQLQAHTRSTELVPNRRRQVWAPRIRSL